MTTSQTKHYHYKKVSKISARKAKIREKKKWKITAKMCSAWLSKASSLGPCIFWVRVGGSALYKGGKLRLQSANPGCTPEKLQISKYFILGTEISKPGCENHPKNTLHLFFAFENEKTWCLFCDFGHSVNQQFEGTWQVHPLT